MPLFVISIKNIFNTISLLSYKAKKKIKNENKFTPIIIILIIILLAMAYGLPYFNIGVNNIIFYILLLYL